MEWSNRYEVKQRKPLPRTSTQNEMQYALHLLHALAAECVRLAQRQFELGAGAFGALACTLMRATRRIGSFKPSGVVAPVSPEASV